MSTPELTLEEALRRVESISERAGICEASARALEGSCNLEKAITLSRSRLDQVLQEIAVLSQQCGHDLFSLVGLQPPEGFELKVRPTTEFGLIKTCPACEQDWQPSESQADWPVCPKCNH